MDDRFPLKWIAIAIFLVVCGCENSTNRKIEKVNRDTLIDRPDYAEIIDLARDPDHNYEQLITKTERFLGDESQLDQQRQGYAKVAVIAAGAHHLAGNEDKSRKWAQKAYEYSLASGIEFPEEWQVHQWVDTLPFATAEKLAQMKDFIIAQNNDGFEDFFEGNKAYLARADYTTAIERYKTALKRGIKDEDQRRDCYLRLSACLFKTQKEQEAERSLLSGWVVFPNLEMNVGDGETKEFLNRLATQYRGQYN